MCQEYHMVEAEMVQCLRPAAWLVRLVLDNESYTACLCNGCLMQLWTNIRHGLTPVEVEDQIPFQGEPMASPERVAVEYYGLESR